MSRISSVYINPDAPTTSDKEVAAHLGISVPTLRDRLRNIGPDHYLTYFPGTIPPKLRRFTKTRRYNSKLGEIKKSKSKSGEVDPTYAKQLVVKLIKISQKYYKRDRCQESKAFLLNETGMLEWYMEAFAGINTEAFLERMKAWVETCGK